MATSSECKFRNVTILKNQYLGRGGYGIVYKAKCDELVCAAKCLYPIFFETGDPGERKSVDRFRTECEMLRKLHHPNIVQYLATHENQEHGADSVILLMEIMDLSLHAYLKNHKTYPLPFHREVDLLFDVSLAIDYLHANDIYHRDLSSKNILLKGEKAKVSDFGVARLRDPNSGYSSDTPCPGQIHYMPPETLKIPPHFERTLDEFSIGVVMIEVMNRKDPEPTNLHVERENQMLEIVPEVIRRKSDINLCNQLNPLLQIALCCISNDPKDRPLADQISRLLSFLQTTTEYRNSTTERHNSISKSMGNAAKEGDDLFNDIVSIEIVDRTGYLQQLKELKQQLTEKDEMIQQQQKQLHIREQQLKENSSHAHILEENLKLTKAQLQDQVELVRDKEKLLKKCQSTMNEKDLKIHDLENCIQFSNASVISMKAQQIDVDQRVSGYIARIEVLESSITEMQREMNTLTLQLRRKEDEIRETRSRLIKQERELVDASLNGLRSLKKSTDRRNR